ncbi:MAG: DUF4389 domain-containing protein [Dehalococcoidales bacterium]|nr:DUF4389 domain-containing protein [Dehalococcoidales bacterium]
MNDTTDYPVKLIIDYPDRELNRVTSFFRIFMLIPIAIIIWLITGPSMSWGAHHDAWRFGIGTASILFLPTLLMILFQQKYPKWWFDWNLSITKFVFRVASYFFLLTDVYPSTDEEQTVHVDIQYPDVNKDLIHWYPLVKWFLAIPHYVTLCFLCFAAFVCLVIAWFAILFTGKYPRGLFDFVVGVYRWDLRVIAYAFMLTTDKYPPFSLD